MKTRPMQRTRYGQYEIVQQIGEGGMGVVYKARHVTLDRIACVKVMLRDPSLDRVPVKRFIGEARAVAKLRHAHIVSIYDCDETEDGIPFIALEYLEGMPLSAWLTATDFVHGVAPRRSMATAAGAVDVHQVVRIVGQLASALEAAHHAGIVHRDVKPDNVFLVVNRVIGRPDDLHVVLLDFGVAKLRETDLTATGLGMGTPAYMAPEQFGDAKHVDGRADVYALGAIVYKMITGGWHAWADSQNDLGSPQEIYRRQTTEPPSDPRWRNPGISEALANVVRRALVCDPRERWATPAELARAIAETVAEEGATANGADLLRIYAPEIWDPGDALWGQRAFMPVAPVAALVDAELWHPPPTAVSWSRGSAPSTAAASPRAMAPPAAAPTGPEANTIAGASGQAHAAAVTAAPRTWSRRRVLGALAGSAGLGLIAAVVAMTAGNGGAGSSAADAAETTLAATTDASGPGSIDASASAPPAPTLTAVAVLTDPTGAAVFVDGDLVDEAAPARLTFEPSRTVRIRAELPGYEPTETTHVVGRAAETVRLTLSSIKPPLDAGTGTQPAFAGRPRGRSRPDAGGPPAPPPPTTSGPPPRPITTDDIAQ